MAERPLIYFSIFLILGFILISTYKDIAILTNFNINLHRIPKRIWTFWDTEDLPPLIHDIQAYNKKVLTEWQITHLNNSNLHTYIPESLFPRNYSTLIPAHKADWIRLYLLKAYGGCWLDASIIINSQTGFNSLYQESLREKSELTCFTTEIYKLHDTLKIPLVFENWFIMAPKQGSLICKWFYEFNRAIEIGFISYKQELIKEGIHIDAIGLDYAKNDREVYLTAFACLNRVLQTTDPLPPIIYKDANETMFKLHSECKYDSKCVMNRIKSTNVKDIPYIKLVGSDRHTNIDISSYFRPKEYEAYFDSIWITR
jgi:hypothetical protein